MECTFSSVKLTASRMQHVDAECEVWGGRAHGADGCCWDVPKQHNVEFARGARVCAYPESETHHVVRDLDARSETKVPLPKHECCKLSGDGRTLTLAVKKSIVQFDSSGGARKLSLKLGGLPENLTHVYVNHDATVVVAMCWEHDNLNYDVIVVKRMDQEAYEIELDEDEDMQVGFVRLSPSGDILALGGQNGEVAAWDTRTGDQLFEMLNEMQGNHIWGLVFTPDERALAVSTESSVVVFHARTGEVLIREAHEYEMHVEMLEFTSITELVSFGRCDPGDDYVLERWQLEWTPHRQILALCGLQKLAHRDGDYSIRQRVLEFLQI